MWGNPEHIIESNESTQMYLPHEFDNNCVVIHRQMSA
jgi:hypothetical protein